MIDLRGNGRFMNIPDQLGKRPSMSATELNELAERASYVGSPEHKLKRWWGGQPGLWKRRGGRLKRPKRQHTTPCPLHTAEDQKIATGWVREAIRQRHFEYVEGDQDFPKKLWHIDDEGRMWQGTCINRTTGEYKGWPEIEVETL